MAFLFKSIGGSSSSSRQKPLEVAKALKDNLTKIDEAALIASSPESMTKIIEENSKIIQQIKFILFGEDQHGAGGGSSSATPTSPQPPNLEASQQMCNEFYMNDLFFCLVASMDKIHFETRKEVVAIAIGLLKRQTGSRFSTVDFLTSHFYIVEHLYSGYKQEQIALNCGMILREVFKFNVLSEMLFSCAWFWNIFEYAKLPEFHVSSDAFATLREVLVRDKSISSVFIQANYDKFLVHLNEFLQSEDYVLKRQTLKLIGELVSDKQCYEFSQAFLASQENLKNVMNFMRDKSKNIAMEAYFLFKLFVLNPQRKAGISGILFKNKAKIISFLEGVVSQEKAEDEEFTAENLKCIQVVQGIQPKKAEAAAGEEPDQFSDCE